MRILHLSSATDWRGGEQQIAFLSEELKLRSVDQLVLCPVGSKLSHWCESNAIPYATFKKRNSLDIFLAHRIKNICGSEHINIIHTHDSHSHTSAILSSVLFGNHVPLIVSRRVDFAVSKTVFSRFKYNHSSVKKIVCVSNAIKSIMAPDIRNHEILEVIYDGIDSNRFSKFSKGILRREFKLTGSTLIIGNVAALAQHKDYFTFVDTAQILINKKLNAKFFIIGEGRLKQQIEKYIAEKKMGDHIIMTGFRNDIENILPELDILLFTSDNEGLGSTILDAFSSGVCVVATDAGGIPEIVVHERTGLLAPVKNPEALAANILRLTSDEKLKERLRNNALEEVKRFTKHEMAASWIALYKKIAADSQIKMNEK